jgi:hypothetical protein
MDVSGDGGIAGSGNTDTPDAAMSPAAPGNDAATVECQPTVELVVNHSSGMTRAFDGQDLWTVVRNVLIDPNVSALPQIQSQVRLGLSLYANPGDVSTAPNPPEAPPVSEASPTSDASTADASPASPEPPAPPAPIPWNPSDDVTACLDVISVPIRINNFESIQLAFTDVEAVGSSPMADGINAAVNKLEAFPGAGPKIIVLTAPGDPDFCLDPDSNSQEAPREAALAAVELAWAKGITTYVVGLDSVGSDGSAAFLQRLAAAGSDDPTATFYDAIDTNALVSAYNQIFQSLMSCDTAP